MLGYREMWKLSRGKLISGKYFGNISIFEDQYKNKWKVCPSMEDDMAENYPLIRTLDDK